MPRWLMKLLAKVQAPVSPEKCPACAYAWYRSGYAPDTRCRRHVGSEPTDAQILDAGGWECHGCGRARPDSMIAVMSDSQVLRGVSLRRNLRYCVDNAACETAVAAKLDEARARAVADTPTRTSES
jgi:hypothetical protein